MVGAILRLIHTTVACLDSDVQSFQMDFLNKVTDDSGTVTKLVENFHKREIACHKTVFYGPRLLELEKNPADTDSGLDLWQGYQAKTTF